MAPPIGGPRDIHSTPVISSSGPRPTACERCRRRKTKCDGRHPRCGACTKAGVDCIEHDASLGRRVDRSYLSSLEQRVAELEAMNPAAASTSPLAMASTGHATYASVRNSIVRGSGTLRQSAAQSANQRQGEQGSVHHGLQPDQPGQQFQPLQSHHHQSEQHQTQSGASPRVAVEPRSSSSDTTVHDNHQLDSNSSFADSQNLSQDVAGSKKRLRESSFDRITSLQAPHQRGSLSPARRREWGSSSPPLRGSNVLQGGNRGSPSNDALTCLVSVALDGQSGADTLPFHEVTCNRVGAHGVEGNFITRELRYLHHLRSAVRGHLRFPAIARNPTKVSLYDRLLVDRLIKRFFSYMGSSFPVAHEVTTAIHVGKVFSGIATVVEEFQVTMMIAVSLATIARSHRHTSDVARLGQDFYRAAHKILGPGVSLPHGIERLQCILLMLLYSLLIPRSSNVARLSSMAMQFAVELNLHSEQAIQRSSGQDALMADLQRRIFWTTYSIDRCFSIIAGRPVTLADDWISTELPTLCEDAVVTNRGIGCHPERLNSRLPICQLKVSSRQQIRLRQLQSTIQSRLHTPLKGQHQDERSAQEELSAWSWTMFDRLCAWRDDFSYPTPFVTKEWVQLQFHLAITLLFRPSPRRPCPDVDSLHMTLHSSVEALKLFKVLHRNGAINFSWMATHSLFMSGLSFLHSLRELHQHRVVCPSMSFVDCVLQVQACASVLEALSLSEGQMGCKARDAFERVSTLIIRQLEKIAFQDAEGNSDARRKARVHSGPGRVSPSASGDRSGQSPNSVTPCRFAVLATDRPRSRDGASVESQREVDQLSSGDARLDKDHFYAHDTDAADLEADRFAALPLHLYEMTPQSPSSMSMYQANGGKEYWSSLSSRVHSRENSPPQSLSGYAQRSVPGLCSRDDSLARPAAEPCAGTDAADSAPKGASASVRADACQSYRAGAEDSMLGAGGAGDHGLPLSTWPCALGGMSDPSLSTEEPIFSQTPSDSFGVDFTSEHALLQALGFSPSVLHGDGNAAPPNLLFRDSN